MRYNNLGHSDIKVSELCLGSMTWGTQNTSQDAHKQIDMALDYGVNFIDTAEMYPTTPLSKDTQGDTERIIGEWIAQSGRRGDVIIATKVSGKGYKNVRDGAPISPASITTAIENSLRSLRTDYIDLYQLHWPNRGSYMFRQNWTYNPAQQDTDATLDHMLEVLQFLESLRISGKIRNVGRHSEFCQKCAMIQETVAPLAYGLMWHLCLVVPGYRSSSDGTYMTRDWASVTGRGQYNQCAKTAGNFQWRW